jgi:anti-sigma regulatory factor (Ser/Thr protein kinase)
MADRRTAPERTSRSGALDQVARLLDEAALCLTVGPPADARIDAALERLGQAREQLAQLALRGAVSRSGRPGEPAPASTALVRRIQLSPTPRAATSARGFCRETCQAWSLPVQLTNAMTDIASELVSNASRHGSGPVVLALELSADQLLVSVWDDGPGAPRRLPYRPGVSEHGIGLQLVDQLSDRWGWAEDHAGKWVWARIDADLGELRVPRPRRRPAPAPGHRRER